MSVRARSGLEYDHRGRDAGVVGQRHVDVGDPEVVGAGEHGAAHLQAGVAGRRVDDLGVVPAHSRRRPQCLGQRLLRREPRGQRRQWAEAFLLGEQPLPHRRRARQGLTEPGDVDHVDADSEDHEVVATYSTVTDLARLRGWSTSWPRWLASSQANSCSGTTATIGCSSVGTRGSEISSSAYGATSSSPSSASTIVRAPRARTSWMPLTILSWRKSRPRGGTTQNTGSRSSTSAIGPCLSSPAANPSAWMYASSFSLSAPSRATG